MPNIPSFAGFNEEVLRRLEKNWSYTESKHPNNKEEQINHFVNLCKQEGEKGNTRSTALKSVFTQEIAYRAKEELLTYYGIRQNYNKK